MSISFLIYDDLVNRKLKQNYCFYFYLILTGSKRKNKSPDSMEGWIRDRYVGSHQIKFCKDHGQGRYIGLVFESNKGLFS
jgi:hypothetical protein